MFTYRLIKALKKENLDDLGMFAFIGAITNMFRFIGAVTLDLCSILVIVFLVILIIYIF